MNCGSDTSVSAGTSISKVLEALVQAAAAIRSSGSPALPTIVSVESIHLLVIGELRASSRSLSEISAITSASSPRSFSCGMYRQISWTFEISGKSETLVDFGLSLLV